MKGLAITDSDIVIKHDGDLVHAQIQRLLDLRINEMFGNLRKGSRLPQMIDTLQKDDTVSDIINEIEYLINQYLTTITLSSIDVEIEFEYVNIFIVTIKFIKPDGDEDTVEIIKAITEG